MLFAANENDSGEKTMGHCTMFWKSSWKVVNGIEEAKA